ncbi:DUF1064 domain-containing protein [Vibrio splendidus]|nr:DUF1064 domain-containing protein [Vibrio splendidus]MCC4880369.1 DUF1064 domain-containing protein [Vibrio splendidus]
MTTQYKSGDRVSLADFKKSGGLAQVRMKTSKSNTGSSGETKTSKYAAKKTEVDGIMFDSGHEAHRYQDLKLLEKIGEISDLKLQPKFPLEVNGILICKYYADFSYFDHTKGESVVEDVKGFRTKEFILKKKLMMAVHGIDVFEYYHKAKPKAKAKPKV